nr:class II aldolase/adducin family protein [Alpinimonas psychrophila]
MSAAGAASVQAGLAIASGGNFSARLHESGNVLVTATGAFLNRLTRESFALLSPDGVALTTIRPSSEWRLHHEVFRVRPDANVIMHLHPEVCVALDMLEVPIRQMTLDHVAYIPTIARIPFFPNGSQALASEAGNAMRHADCLVLGNHGCSVLGTTVDDAFRRANNLEQAARMTYNFLVLGDKETEFPPALRATAVHSG